MTIVVAGGAGFIGKNLLESLLDDGHTVIVVDRVPPNRTHPQLFFIPCDVATQPLPYNILEHTDAVINLVGEPLTGTWTPEKKERIRQSRVNSTRHIVESIAATKSRPGVFVNASSAGFYADAGDEASDEQGLAGNDYLAEVVTEWEAAAREALAYGVRVVCIRTAPVLGGGGLLAGLRKTSALGFLVAPTKQDPWFSWIHVFDLVQAYRFAVDTTTLQGVVNAGAPEPVRLQEFMRAVSRSLRRPLLGIAPKWAVRALYGTMAGEYAKNVRVVPRRLSDKGFTFRFPVLADALNDILQKK